MTTTLTDVRCVAVPVRDQDAALAFYVDALGFEQAHGRPDQRHRCAGSRSPHPARPPRIALVAGPDNPAPGVDTGVRFAVADAAAEHQSLRDRGVAVGELLAWPDVPPMFTFDDPDGNRFYVVADLS